MTQPDPFAKPTPGAEPPAWGSAPAYGQPPAPSGAPGAQPYGQPPAYGQAPDGYGYPGAPGMPGALASPWLRLGALLLNVVLMVVTLGIGYLVWCMVLWQQGTNPAKKMLGMKIVSAETGQTLDWSGMFVRNFVFGGLVLGVLQLITLGIFYLVDSLTVFGDKKQRLVADKWAKSLVVMA